jgi:ATP/ADP translocase
MGIIHVGDEPLSYWHHIISKWTAFALFVIQNGFVQLLYTQHWSFLGSMNQNEDGTALSDAKSSAWFSPVAGIGSGSSTLAAYTVTHLVDRVGLSGLLWLAAGGICVSVYFAELAYSVAEKHGFEPHQEASKDATRKATTNDATKVAQSEHNPQDSIIRRAINLFTRVPVLGALCVEVLVCQCLSSLAAFLFVLKVKETIVDDEERAAWTGSVS